MRLPVESLRKNPKTHLWYAAGVQPFAQGQLVAHGQPVAQAQPVHQGQPVAQAQPVAQVQPVAQAQPVAQVQAIARVQSVPKVQILSNQQELCMDQKDEHRQDLCTSESSMEARSFSPTEQFAANVFRERTEEFRKRNWVENVWDPSPSLAAETSSLREPNEEDDTIASNGSLAYTTNSLFYNCDLSYDWSLRAAPELSLIDDDNNKARSRRTRGTVERNAFKQSSDKRRHMEIFDPFIEEGKTRQVSERSFEPVVRVVTRYSIVTQSIPSHASTKDLHWHEELNRKSCEPVLFRRLRAAERNSGYRGLSTYSPVREEHISSATFDASVLASFDEKARILPSDNTSAIKRKSHLKPFKDCVKFLTH